MFGDELKVIRIDRSAVEFYGRLNDLFYQFRAIANNYNQVVHALHRGFSERSARRFLAQLVRHTRELKAVSEQILALIGEFNDRYLGEWSQK